MSRIGDCAAEPLSIARIPANRAVKVKFTVKVNENFPRSAIQISNGVSVTSSSGGNIVLPGLTQPIYYTPSTPTIVTQPGGGVSKDPRPTLGGGADPNATIEIYDGDTLIGTTTTDGLGSWTFSPSQALSYGHHTLKIRSVNGLLQSSELGSFNLKIDCPSGVFGATCSSVCPGGLGNICGGHGTCSEGLEGTGTCSCASGYFDVACTQASPVCAIDLSDGVHKDSEWGNVKSVLNTSNRRKGRPYYWKSGHWTRNKPSSYDFITDPKAWFAISNAKSCLGYQNGIQVLHLLLRSQFPLASYYHRNDGHHYRFGLGALSDTRIPERRIANVVWKLMPVQGGAIYYIVLRLEYNQGDTYKNSAYRSLELYRESSSNSFEATKFAKQKFDASIDTYIQDLGNVVNGLVDSNVSLKDEELPAVETGVDLIRLLSATGWSTSTPLMMQVATQEVKGTEAKPVTSEIDRTGTTVLANVSTSLGLAEPTLRIRQASTGRVRLTCESPRELKVKKYFFQLVKFSKNKSVKYASKRKGINARVVARSAYSASCYYLTKSGLRSDPSATQRFRAKK